MVLFSVVMSSFFGQRPLLPLLLLGPPFLLIIIFPANWDQHLLACTMASNFSVAWHRYMCLASVLVDVTELTVSAQQNCAVLHRGPLIRILD
jgi:hypothetical protein